jgi:nitrile hydratase
MSETSPRAGPDHAGHGHPHDPGHHPGPADEDGPLTYHQVLETAVRELLIEKGILSPAEITDAIARMDARSPAQGARVVAKAWTDPGFRADLLADGSAACTTLGIDMGPTRLKVVADEPGLHNVVVCTLCSCYPRALLGLPPAWYKSKSYRARMVREPRTVLAEFGTVLPEGVALRVHDSTADLRYLVLPERPAGTDGWDEAALAAIVTRDCMIGVTLPDPARPA